MEEYQLPIWKQKIQRADEHPTVFPPGKYWVGDPCYAIRNSGQWDQYGASNGWFQDTPIGVDGGYWCIGIGTKYGDGVYHDQHGREYPVDAGMIGITPYYQWERSDPPFGSHLIEFKYGGTAFYDSGTIHIEDLRIDTDPEDSSEEYEDEETE